MELLASQENEPGTHHSQRECANLLGISRAAVRRVSKRNGLNNFKPVTTPQLETGAVQRRVDRSRALFKRFRTGKVRQLVFQDEKDFPIQVPVNRQNNRVYGKGKKSEISSSRLYHRKNKFSKKLMVSACVSWNGTTKPFFVDPGKVKVNARHYVNHLQKELLAACDVLQKGKKYYYMQEGAPSHTANITQQYLKEKFGRRFIRKDQWPPNSPDCSPLDYFFWDAVKQKVYEGRRERFSNLDELK